MTTEKKETEVTAQPALDLKKEAQVRGPLVKEWTETKQVRMSNRKVKEKTYAYRKYKSGVIKRRLVGLRKVK